MLNFNVLQGNEGQKGEQGSPGLPGPPIVLQEVQVFSLSLDKIVFTTIPDDKLYLCLFPGYVD